MTLVAEQLAAHEEPEELHRAVWRIIENQTSRSTQNRKYFRVPYFCPADILPHDRRIWVPAYIYDISAQGIGFTHLSPIAEGDVQVKMNLHDGDTVVFKAQIAWTMKLERMHFRSGGRLLQVVKKSNPPA